MPEIILAKIAVIILCQLNIVIPVTAATKIEYTCNIVHKITCQLKYILPVSISIKLY